MIKRAVKSLNTQNTEQCCLAEMLFGIECWCVSVFLEGMTESQLDAIEKCLHATLPNDFRCSFRLFGGQENRTATPGYGTSYFKQLVNFE